MRNSASVRNTENATRWRLINDELKFRKLSDPVTFGIRSGVKRSWFVAISSLFDRATATGPRSALNTWRSGVTSVASVSIASIPKLFKVNVAFPDCFSTAIWSVNLLSP